jgi:cytoskeletal protein CcmA (bactofilin family)
MFGSKKKEEVKTTITSSTNNTSSKTPSVEAGSNALNSLVKGTVVEGSITSESDIRVDGIIKGNLTCQSKVIIGISGFIEGEVRCQNAMVEGRFYGKMRVAELLTVKESAEVIGDVATGKLIIANGAVFNVTCKMKDSFSGGNHTNSNGASKQVKEAELVQNGKS